VAFAPDGKRIALTHAGRIWEVWSGREFQTPHIPASNNAVAFSQDGRFQAWSVYTMTGPSEVDVLESVTGRTVAHFREGGRSSIDALAFSPDGRRLATGHRDSTILIWDLSQGRLEPGRASSLGEAELQKRWEDLAGHAGDAYAALWDLVACPEVSVPFLARRLSPAKDPDPAQLDKRVKELGSENFAIRNKAALELQALGESAEFALHRAIEAGAPLEVKRRVEALLLKLPELRTNSENVRVVRAAAALEYVGNADARRLLETLAEGAPGAILTREAQESLQRLSRRDR
jgi:hypothetical protein